MVKNIKTRLIDNEDNGTEKKIQCVNNVVLNALPSRNLGNKHTLSDICTGIFCLFVFLVHEYTPFLQYNH